MLTQQQIQEMDKVSGAGSTTRTSSTGNVQASPLASDIQGVSGALRSLGLGVIPNNLAQAYSSAHGQNPSLTPQQKVLSAAGPLGSVPNPQQVGNTNPFETQQVAAQQSKNPTAQVGINAAGFLPWILGMANPMGMSGKAMATRAGIGGASGLLSNIGQGKGGNLTSDALSTLIGGVANTYIPPALDYAGGKIAQVAYGKAGKAIPDIAAETGTTITGSGSQGAKQAASDIGQKIGDLYDQMGTGMTKDELFNILDDTPVLDQAGTPTPTNLDYFMKEAGIPAENKPQVLNFIKTMAVGAGMRRSLGARANQAASGTIEKEFNAALDQYAAENPDISQQLTAQGIDNASIPGGFWQDFKSAIKPSQKVYDAMSKSPDYVPSIEDKIRLQLSDTIANKLQDKLGQQSPEALSQLQNLNKLYGAAIPIAKGTAKGILPYHLGIMAQLAALGMLAAPATGMKESPYLQMLAPLGLMANPAVSGTVASQMATPTTNAIVNALSSLGASKLANKVVH